MPDKPSLLDRVRGKRAADIALPNDTGQIDSRLQRKPRRGERPGPNLYAGMAKSVNKMTRSVKRNTRRR